MTVYTIPSTKSTGNSLAASDWNTYVRDNFEVVKYRQLQFLPLRGSGTYTLPSSIGNHSGISIGDATTDGTAYYEIYVPSNYLNISVFKIRVISPQTNTMMYSAAVDYGGNGELYNVATASISVISSSLTANTFKDIDLSSLINSAQAGRTMGLAFTRAGSNGSDLVTTVLATCVYLEYYP